MNVTYHNQNYVVVAGGGVGVGRAVCGPDGVGGTLTVTLKRSIETEVSSSIGIILTSITTPSVKPPPGNKAQPILSLVSGIILATLENI